MSNEQPFIWKTPYGWGRVPEDLQGGANSVSQVDGDSDMAPAYWFHVREGLAKRKWPLLTLMLNASVSPCILLVLFQAAMQVLELRESESERGESICAFFKRNCLGLQKFLPPTQSLLVFAVRSCGDLSSWHWNPQLGAWYWSGTPHS